MIVNHFIVAIASLASLATASSVKSCSGAILCIDYINDCGDKYGGYVPGSKTCVKTSWLTF